MVHAEAWIVAATFGVMVLSNILSQRRYFGGKDNKIISDSNPTYLTPDGPTFAVWGFIYLFELVLVAAQLLHSHSMEDLFARRCPLTGLNVRERLIAAFATNAFWLPIFSNERFWAALVVMLAYLAFLLSVYKDLNVEHTHGLAQTVVLTTGVAMNTSWIVVASSVSLFLCGGRLGWKDKYGVCGSPAAAMLVVLLVTALGCERVWRGGDVAWAFVAAWALRGIYRMQSIGDRVRFPIGALNASLGDAARLGSFVVWAVLVAKCCLWVYHKLHHMKVV
mmetsp:Transcript_48492/g.141266  ORF Transcript_48492/g.141266 Transcript_48492/m.141266 type:complete len:278 (-) Transcript_48492:281-1114(-)